MGGLSRGLAGLRWPLEDGLPGMYRAERRARPRGTELRWAEWTRIGPNMDGGADVDRERGGGLVLSAVGLLRLVFQGSRVCFSEVVRRVCGERIGGTDAWGLSWWLRCPSGNRSVVQGRPVGTETGGGSGVGVRMN